MEGGLTEGLTLLVDDGKCALLAATKFYCTRSFLSRASADGGRDNMCDNARLRI